MISSLTINEIRKLEGLEEHFDSSDGSPLSIWYSQILGKSIKELTDEDIAKLVRQNTHVNFVIKELKKRIVANPLCGELYEGELIAALTYVQVSFWHNNFSMVEEFQELLSSILDMKEANKLSFNSNEDMEDYFIIVNNVLKKLSTFE